MSQPDMSQSLTPPWWTNIQRRWMRPRHVLRIGRHELSLWRDTPDGLQHLAQEATPTASTLLSNAVDLRDTWLPVLSALLSHSDQRALIDVIVESACMPVSLLTTGTRLWSGQQIHTLAHHRLSTTYGDAALQWQVQSSYLAGDAHALAFGLPRELQQVIEQAAREAQVAVRSVQPALAWGWDRVVAQTWAMPGSSAFKTFWWVWPEQDRDVVIWVERGRISGLNPAVACSDQSPQRVVASIATESARLGVADEEVPIRAATWSPLHAPSPIANTSSGLTQRLRWDVLIDTSESLAARGAA